VYLRRFYQKYHGKSRDEALRTLLDGVRVTPRAVVVALRSVWPGMQAQDLAPWLARYVPDEQFTAEGREALFQRYAPEKFNLNDRGYLARVHPLELWLIDYLQQHPDATRDEVLAAGTEVRQEVYGWLMKTSRRRAQDRRILDLLEIEAFQQLHRQWQRLGYPFASLTPSLATAIGSSGDRPAALAELMGTIVQGGVRYPSRLVTGLHFAAGTPYEVEYAAQSAEGKRVMHPEVAQTARAALLDVVQEGTARALLPQLVRARRFQPPGRRQDRHRRSPLRGLCLAGTAARVARGEPRGDFRVHDRRPLLRHHHGLRAGCAGRAVRVHQRPAGAPARRADADAGAAARRHAVDARAGGQRQPGNAPLSVPRRACAGGRDCIRGIASGYPRAA
jgi:hypothetical protein